nr:hypothetical protein [Tanacetum cinerariifolium]
TYEEHALKSLRKKEQSSAVVDPLTYLAKTTPTHFTTLPVTIVTKTVQRRAPGNTGTKGIQTTGSGMNNSGKKVICYNCHGEGHVSTQCKEPKRARDSQWYHDKALLMQAKDKGAALDDEVKAFLADQEEHLNSEVDSVLDDNMITYDEYQELRLFQL